MAPAARAAIRLAPFALGALGLVVLIVAATNFINSSGFAFDFNAYDLAARRIVAGQPLYPEGVGEGYDSTTGAGLYLYAPPLAVALVPLTLLSPGNAAIAWLWLRVAILVIAIAGLPVSGRVRAAILGVAGFSFPVLNDLNLGNVSILVFALAVAIWRYRDRPVAAAALALAGSLRYSFVIVLWPWLAARRPRMIGAVMSTGALIAVATLPIVGVDTWVGYLRAITSLRNVATGPHNLTLGTTAAALGLPGPAPIWTLFGFAIVIAAAVFASRRRDFETTVVVSLAGTLLFYPFLHSHYLVLLLVPAAFLVARGHWWALGLPLVAWLPAAVHPVAAIVGVVGPLVVGGVAPHAGGSGSPQLAGPFEPGGASTG